MRILLNGNNNLAALWNRAKVNLNRVNLGSSFIVISPMLSATIRREHAAKIPYEEVPTSLQSCACESATSYQTRSVDILRGNNNEEVKMITQPYTNVEIGAKRKTNQWLQVNILLSKFNTATMMLKIDRSLLQVF